MREKGSSTMPPVLDQYVECVNGLKGIHNFYATAYGILKR